MQDMFLFSTKYDRTNDSPKAIVEIGNIQNAGELAHIEHLCIMRQVIWRGEDE